VWTRFGTEAGQTIDRILARKEAERIANGGLFLWGIGNSVATGIEELLRAVDVPEVLFSPIKARPRQVDVAPSCVVAWMSGETLDGQMVSWPHSVNVLSRGERLSAVRPHYALVCSASGPLETSDLGRLRIRELRNLKSGSPLGASQVTAVVHRAESSPDSGTDYVVALRTRLVAPYFVRLRDPVVVFADATAQRDLGRLAHPEQLVAFEGVAPAQPTARLTSLAFRREA
jgi:hypothetical protein